MATFNVPQAAEFFNRSVETVRLWCIEFQEYLSPTANPGEGKTRLLTDDDMAVLALVHERKSQGVHSEDVHGDLRQGQRGSPPAMSPDELTAVTTSSETRRLTLENEILKGNLATLQEQLASLQTAREEAVRLQTRLESESARADNAEKALEALREQQRGIDARIVELSERAARAETEARMLLELQLLRENQDKLREQQDKFRRWPFGG